MMLSPPSSKKLSSMPTAASPSISANSAHSTSSCGVRGARRAVCHRRPPAPAARAGRACRWASAAARPAPRTPTAPCSRAGCSARCARNAAHRRRIAPSAATTYATSRVGSPASSRATTAACATPGCRSSAASISPSSMRKPRSFTWGSRRPRNSSSPSAASAPGRRCGTSARPAGRRTDRPRTAPPSGPAAPGSRAPDPPRQCTARPRHADGHRLQARVEHVGRVFQIGRPIGTSFTSIARDTPARDVDRTLRSGRTDCSAGHRAAISQPTRRLGRQRLAAADEIADAAAASASP